MEKSIENIWTNSFIAEEKLSAPKLNRLYSQKSKSIIEKLKITYEIDNKSLIPMAIIFGLCFGYTISILVGMYTFLVLLGLYKYNNTLLKELYTVDISSENYTYLVTYKKTIDKITKRTKMLVLFIIPTIILVGFVVYATTNDSIINYISTKNIASIVSSAIFGLIGVALIAYLSYFIGFKLVYASLLSRLDDLIRDIEALNS